MDRIRVREKEFVRLYGAEEIGSRVDELAGRLLQTFEGVGDTIDMCVIMNGAFMFAADLVRKLDVRFRLHFLRLKSYEGMHRGELVLSAAELQPGQFAGKHVVLLDDIVDSGRTLHRLREEILLQGPLSVRVACLLFKPASLEVPLEVWFAGFRIGPAFVIGYGMDFDQQGRGLKDIYQHVEDF